MPTIWDDSVRVSLATRARAITPSHTARWGTLSAAGMLAHVNDATRMGLGDLPVSAKTPAILRWPPVRYLVIHVLPMPKGAPTAPELLARSSSADVTQEQQTFEALLARLVAADTLATTHPVFGAMTRRDWGVLMHKHVDHHLRQFGC